MIKNTVAYRLISSHYGDQVARRSQVPLMNHINEGLIVLDSVGATEDAKLAFCIHPILQADADLEKNYYIASFVDHHVLLLAMEYRSVANEYLSDKVNTGQKIRLSPLKEVNDMLIADKVQNYKDFITYHHGTHTRSNELHQYFREWLDILGVDTETYNRLCKEIDESKQT
jgi:hypothetical protein